MAGKLPRSGAAGALVGKSSSHGTSSFLRPEIGRRALIRNANQSPLARQFGSSETDGGASVVIEERLAISLAAQ